MTPNTATTWPIADLHGWDKNPRGIKKDAFERLKRQITAHGQFKPVLVTADGEVIGGNMRLKAYQALGITDVWVSVVTPKDETEKIAIALADNDRAGYYEEEALAELIMSVPDLVLEDYHLDLGKTLSAADMLDRFRPTEEDDFDVDAELPDEPVSKLGDVFQLGNHRLMCGDSTDPAHVALLMNGVTSELLFTSPPYSDMREYNGGKDLGVDNLTTFIPTYYPYVSYMAVNLGIQRKEGEIYDYWTPYILAAQTVGYKFLAWNVWAKDGAGSIGNQDAFIPIAHEWIFVFGKAYKEINKVEQKKTNDILLSTTRRKPDGSMKTSTTGSVGETFKKIESVTMTNTEKGKIRAEHPATFPIGLPTPYIKSITTAGDTIVDPFGGSGSTLIACEQLGRSCYMMELDPRYCDVIIKRWEQFTGEKAIKVTA